MASLCSLAFAEWSEMMSNAVASARSSAGAHALLELLAALIGRRCAERGIERTPDIVHLNLKRTRQGLFARKLGTLPVALLCLAGAVQLARDLPSNGPPCNGRCVEVLLQEQ